MDNLQCVILGKSGTGKSVFSRYILDKYKKNHQYKNIVVIDENNTSWPFLSSLGFKKVEITKELAMKSFDWYRIISENKYIFIEVTGLLEYEISFLLDQICSTIYELKNTGLFIDEAHNFFPRENYSKELARLFRSGRKKGVDLFIITQMVVDLNIVAIKQANLLISFQLTENNELQKIKNYFDTIEDNKPEEILKGLTLGEYIIKDMRKGGQIKNTTKKLHNIKKML